jgi:predicted PurR-regulated permease PerM
MAPVRLDGTQIFDWLLILLGLVLLASILLPFWSALVFAAVLAGIFSGLQRRLSKRLGGRRALAAGLLTVLVLLAVLLPTAAVTTLLARQAVGVFQGVRSIFQEGGMEGLLARVPGPLRRAADWVVEMSGGAESASDWLQLLQSQSGKAATGITKVLSTTSQAVLEAALLLIAFYFLLLDGQRLVRWMERALPMAPGRFRSFLDEFRQVSRAVVVSSVGTAGVQAAAALVGLLIARIPNALLWTLLTFFMAFIPAVGAASVSVVMAVVLFFQGQTGWALFLAVWGVVVVGLSDNVVKPLLIKGGVEMHGAVIFFALLGGLAAFGPVGLVVGPLVVAFILALTGTRGVPSASER